MSSSFQSTAYQSFAQPVNTFVEPVKVLPKTNMMALAETLKVVNPVLEKFIETKIDEKRAEISEEALNDALDSSTNDWADASKYVRSNKLFSGNRLYNKVFKRTKATILGGSLESKFKTEYNDANVDGVPLSNFSLDSTEFSDWLNETRTEVINSLGDVDSDTFNKKFFPYLINATTKITDIHEKKHEEFQVEKLKIDAAGLAKNIINFQTAGPDSDEVSKNQFLLLTASIDQFENDINKLGLSSANRSAINKTILNSLSAEAKRIGFETGDEDLALSVFKSASQFPFGPGGKLTLLDHPDYVEMENKLLEDVEDYTDKADKRNRAEAKRAKEEALELGMLNVAALYTAGKGEEAVALLEKLQDANPLLATKLQANAEALDGDTNQKFGILLKRITENNFDTLADARTAAMAWFLDPGTLKSDLNVNRLNTLMKLAGTVDKGVLTPLNSYFVRYEDQSKLLLTLDPKFKIFSQIGKEQQLTTVKLNTEAFKNEFREYKLANPDADTGQLEAKYEQLKTTYNNKLINDLNALLDPSSKQVDNNTKFINENQSGLEGVAIEGDGNNNDNETGDFFGNTSLPSVESRVIAELIRMGGITKENRDKLIEEVVAEKAKMNFTNIVGKSEADRIIRFLQTGEYGFGNKTKIYEPMKLLVDTDNFEAAAFSDDDSPTTVEVQPGDTLSQLAEEFGIPLKDFMEANNITNADLIKAGQELIVPIVEAVTPNETKIETKTKNKLPEVELNKLRQEIKLKTDKKQPLTKQQINKLLLNAGFTKEQAKIMTAIAMAESANKANAFYGGTEKNPEASYGLFQINMYNYKGMELGNDRQPKLGIDNNEDLYDPVLNAIAAKLVFDETQALKGNGYLAWGVYSKDGQTEDPDAKYKKFLD